MFTPNTTHHLGVYNVHFTIWVCIYLYKTELDIEKYMVCVPILKVRGPFVQTLCIEKDSYMDAIERVNIFK